MLKTYFSNVIRRLFWLLLIGSILYLISKVNQPTKQNIIEPTPTAATIVSTDRLRLTPTPSAQIVFEEPSSGLFAGETIILKTDVFYRGEPTGDEAYWVVTGDIAREVADTILSNWNDSFTTDEGYVVNIVTREVSKKLNVPYKCTLLEGGTAVSLYAYGDYLPKSVCT